MEAQIAKQLAYYGADNLMDTNILNFNYVREPNDQTILYIFYIYQDKHILFTKITAKVKPGYCYIESIQNTHPHILDVEHIYNMSYDIEKPIFELRVRIDNQTIKVYKLKVIDSTEYIYGIDNRGGYMSSKYNAPYTLEDIHKLIIQERINTVKDIQTFLTGFLEEFKN